MRSLLERAIVHVLNDEPAKAEALFHKFLINRARSIHESLRQGEDVALNEGWDDEVQADEYFSADDLSGDDDLGDVADAGAEHGDAAADLGDDMGVPGDEHTDDMAGDTEMGDEHADLGGEPDDLGAPEGDTPERLDAIEDSIEQLIQMFQDKMNDIDGDDAEGDKPEGEGEEPDFDGFADSAEGDEPKDDAEGLDGDDAEKDDESEKDDDGVATDDEDVIGEDDESADDDESLDEITESVLADLEKVVASVAANKEVGAGKTISGNDKSALPNNGVSARQGGKPVMTKGVEHTGYDLETAPTSKKLSTGKNRMKGAGMDQKVAPKGDASALLNKDFAGGSKTGKSVIDG